MLAYLFWHRPLERTETDAYEQAQLAFHRSLHRAPPVGLYGSALFRLARRPFGDPAGSGGEDGPAYEDWYLVEDFTALGVLNGAAVGRGHRTAHDEAARRFGAGAGGLYGLIEGEHGGALQSAREARLAVWVARPPGSRQRGLGELLGDGLQPDSASLWRRQLVLGPAPEFCLLARELPEGWKATVLEREPLWSG